MFRNYILKPSKESSEQFKEEKEVNKYTYLESLTRINIKQYQKANLSQLYAIIEAITTKDPVSLIKGPRGKTGRQGPNIREIDD